MPMNENPDEINDADRHIKAKLLEEGQGYAERNAISKKQNKDRAESRDRVKKLGIHTKSFQWAILLAKDFSPAEAKQILRDTKIVYDVMVAKAPDLFPEEVMRVQKREADRKAREQEAKTKAGRSADHPRSDPKSGGAGKGKKKPKAIPPVVDDQRPTTAKEAAGAAAAEGDAMIKSAAEAIQGQNNPGEHEDEQSEGAAVLDALAPETRSQSEEAEARRKAAGLN